MKPLATLAIIATSFLAVFPAYAAKRPWDVMRYGECLKKSGTDPLAPDLAISSTDCRSTREAVEAREGMPSGTVAKAFVIGSRNKDNPAATFVAIAIGVGMQSSSIYVSGNQLASQAAHPVNIGEIYAMVGGTRQKLVVTGHQVEPADCSSFYKGAVAVRQCSFKEAAGIVLTQPILDEVRGRLANEPEGTFRFRVEATGGSLTLTVPLAEIEAVRAAVALPMAK